MIEGLLIPASLKTTPLTPLAAAKAAGRPVMLDFYADWCVSCKEMEAWTFTDAGVQAALSNTVWLQADVTDAMRARDVVARDALRMVIASVKAREIDSDQALTDEDRLRRDVIERLMCDFSFSSRDLVDRFGAILEDCSTPGVDADGHASTADRRGAGPADPPTVETRRGRFTYMADAALFEDCGSGLRFPVAMEADYLAAERAYLETAPLRLTGPVGLATFAVGNAFLFQRRRLQHTRMLDSAGDQRTPIPEHPVQSQVVRLRRPRSKNHLRDTAPQHLRHLALRRFHRQACRPSRRVVGVRVADDDVRNEKEPGLFWQHDVRDGMEESISGSRRVRNARPTLNSYMYANAVAISASFSAVARTYFQIGVLSRPDRS